MKRSLAVLTFTMMLGCASAPPVRTWLDPETAATITAHGDPLVLARDEHMRAVNVRDYAQLGAVEVNRMGERKLYLVALLWSTIDRTQDERRRVADAFARIELQADDQTIALSRFAGEARALGVGASPYSPPVPGALEIYFPVRRADLRALALSRSLRLTAIGDATETLRYNEWRFERAGLARFLGQLPD